MNEEQFNIDFSHPDIIRARASAYALLLQWRKEREVQSAQLIGGEAVNPSTNLRNPADEVYCLPSEESPTPAVSEQE